MSDSKIRPFVRLIRRGLFAGMFNRQNIDGFSYRGKVKGITMGYLMGKIVQKFVFWAFIFGFFGLPVAVLGTTNLPAPGMIIAKLKAGGKPTGGAD